MGFSKSKVVVPLIRKPVYSSPLITIAGPVPDWIERSAQNSPYFVAVMNNRERCNDPSRFGSLSSETKLILLRTRGVRANVPTPEAHILLTGTKTDVRNSTNARPFVLHNLGFLHKIPSIIGRKRVTYRTSMAGIELMQFWVETDTRFRKFFDAYVVEADIQRCRAWAATLAMGIELEMVANALKQDADIRKAREAAERLCRDTSLFARNTL